MTPTFDANNLRGVDVYHGDAALNFHALAAAGVAFAFVKASQGADGLDPHFADNYARAKAAGLTAGAYHFFTPTGDPVQQARHFLNAAPLTAGDLVWCLDVETDGPDVGAEALACAREIKAQTGRYPTLYTGDAFYRDRLAAHFPPGDYTLWIARYGARPATPCAFWQYSEGESYPHNSALDSNVFHGTAADLKRHCL